MSNTTPPPKQLLGIAPYFLVSDVVKAAEYYRDVLGFNYGQIWGEPPDFCMPGRDGLIIMLSQTCDPSIVRPNAKARNDESWDAYVWVRDADALFAEFKAKGAIVHYEPMDQPHYGNREFAIKDLDGYIIAFAHDIASHKKS